MEYGVCQNRALFIVLCFALVGCNQEETIKAPKEIQAETPQTEHIEKNRLQLKNAKVKGIKV